MNTTADQQRQAIDMHYFIKADRFLLEDKETGEGYLEVKDGVFGRFQEVAPSHPDVRDFSGCLVAPGLFDTHVHGIKGYDFMDGEERSVAAMSEELAKLGVTSFLPTSLTSTPEVLEKALLAYSNAVSEGLPGAVSEGVFLEGPYFTEKYKGAQNEEYFKDPDLAEFGKWQEMAGGEIVKIALAPERSGAASFIRNVTERGVKVGLGHTDATFECCMEAVGNGADTFIHLFNGMRGMHHREPGTVGAAFRSDDSFAELICDGYHVHPEMAALVYKVKGENLMLITDCMRAGGMPNGSYMLGDLPVVMEDGVARTESGSLGGSTLELKEGIRKLKEWTGASLKDIWHLASLTPARSVGREKEIGSIRAGKRADFVAVDQNLDVQATVVRGNTVYTL